MSSWYLLIVPVAWAFALGVMIYFRYRDQDELNPPVTERRRQERRNDDVSGAVSARAAQEKLDDQRSDADRRQRQAWNEDYNVLKEKLEKDGPVEP